MSEKLPDFSWPIEEITGLLKDFYDPSQVHDFYMSPQPLLDNKIPLDLIKNGEGERVVNLAKQIADGIFK